MNVIEFLIIIWYFMLYKPTCTAWIFGLLSNLKFWVKHREIDYWECETDNS